jgi:autophagy-related protein 17
VNPLRKQQEAQAEFFESIQSCGFELQRMKLAMPSSADNPPSTESPIPILLHGLESNAAEMASLLDSLVRHFDLCVNAIKHTEGGFAAVRQAANDNQLPDGVTVSGVIQDTSNDSGLVLEPLSAEDRKQMLTILSNDAAEVEGVVAELHQYLATMEEQYEQIQGYVSAVSSAYASSTAEFALLESVGAQLPAYMASSQDFLLRWVVSKAKIEEQMEELESMRIFYEGYLSSYDGLIIEVSRRRAAEEKMKGLLRKTMEQIQKLHDVDTRQRERFRREVGDFLPSDLWLGLVAEAPRFEIDVIGDENGGVSTPELQRAVLEAAARRDKERRR